MKAGSKHQVSSRHILNGAGQRVTAQRALLLDLIREEGGHPEADELYRRAKEKHPRLSLSTVYRTLQLFKRLGLIEEHHFDEDHHHYEAKTHPEHHHLVCFQCGKVTEFESEHIQQMKQEISNNSGFEILGAKVRLIGICSGCQDTGERQE
jgi:Fe2+ or Zn2+ uptake regulation protein